MNKQLKWKQIGVGVIKYLSEQLSLTKIDYLLGAAYNYSEVDPKSFNVFFQIWFQQ